MTTILFAILAILAILWVAAPVMSEAEASVEGAGRRPRVDPARSVLDQITDLDLEYAAGKIPDAAYKQVRSDLAVQAAAAISARENVTADVSAQDAGPITAPEKASPGASGARQASPERSEAQGKGNKKSRAAAFCPGCGQSVTVQDKFCAGCGRNLKS